MNVISICYYPTLSDNHIEYSFLLINHIIYQIIAELKAYIFARVQFAKPVEKRTDTKLVHATIRLVSSVLF